MLSRASGRSKNIARKVHKLQGEKNVVNRKTKRLLCGARAWLLLVFCEHDASGGGEKHVKDCFIEVNATQLPETDPTTELRQQRPKNVSSPVGNWGVPSECLGPIGR